VSDEQWRYDPSMVPEFVQVPDGYYYESLVLDGPIVATWQDESAPTVTEGKWKRVKLDSPIQKFKTELRWKESWDAT